MAGRAGAAGSRMTGSSIASEATTRRVGAPLVSTVGDVDGLGGAGVEVGAAVALWTALVASAVRDRSVVGVVRVGPDVLVQPHVATRMNTIVSAAPTVGPRRAR